MTEQPKVVHLLPPESARFVNVLPSTSAQYVLYTTVSAVMPDAFDQVLKNHTLPVGADLGTIYQPFGPVSEG
jgi:hypothetical protein